MKNVEQAADEIGDSKFDALPGRVQEALGELAGAAKDGLLALSVGVGLGVLAELMAEEVDDVVGPKAVTTSSDRPFATGMRPGRSRSVAAACPSRSSATSTSPPSPSPSNRRRRRARRHEPLDYLTHHDRNRRYARDRQLITRPPPRSSTANGTTSNPEFDSSVGG